MDRRLESRLHPQAGKPALRGYSLSRIFSCLVLALTLLGPEAARAERLQFPQRPDTEPARPRIGFEKDVLPLLSRYCYGCHGEKKKGDLDLRIYQNEASAVRDRQVFEKVLKNLQAHEMPPEKKPQPTPDERDVIAAWIQGQIFECDCNHPDPGRVTLRRLNRVEYNNTIRDLLGVSFRPADDFPADDIGYGFDNIGDVLSLPPVLFEKYLAASEQILGEAIVTDFTPISPTQHFQAAALEGTAPGGPIAENMRILTREGDLHVTVELRSAGEYILRARAYGEQAGPDPARMAFLIDGKEIKRFDVTAEQFNPATYEMRLTMDAGKKKFSAAYLNNFVNPKDPDPTRRDRNLVIDYLEVVAPGDATPRSIPESHKRIFICQPAPGHERECSRAIIGSFARKAYRRPIETAELDRLTALAENARVEEKSFERGIQVALEAVLVSPHFLFRGDLRTLAGSALQSPHKNEKANARSPAEKPASALISEYELASRLSYFLWSTMPDEPLLAQADRGSLRKNLAAEVKRMLRDAKARALVDNFAGQWLQLRSLSQAAPDKQTFPAFDEELRAAMQQETELFFESIAREDRSVLELLDADYTFVNERLARHYGLSNVKGPAFQRVSLTNHQRGGILTHASVLTITSNPTRTSPVKRGKWVLDNILGTPPPPPPPDVPELKEGKEAALTGSLRQRMEQHRAKPLCASCHSRMDPIGFGFENYDGIGAWREKDAGFAIDPAGQLVTGESFQGPNQLKEILLKAKRNDFVRCLCEKMLTYALGRGLEPYDRCATDQLAKGLANHHYRFSSLVLEITRSVPFQMRRAPEGPLLSIDSR